jgi:aryl-alcohol dehydrogenase-like predicted oxidoreductase
MFRAIAQYTKLFPLGLGAMPLSLVGKPSEKEAIEVVISFLAIGGNFIDTADVYGLGDNDRGHNEKLIAKALKQYGDQDGLLIATKGGASRPDDRWALGGGDPKKLRLACEQSLKNLEREVHPLYYLHGPDPKVPLADSLGELIKLKEEGKILNIGIANVDLAELQFALQLTPVAAVQNRCNLFCKGDFKNGLINFCFSNQIAYVPYCPLGGWADHSKLSKEAVFQALALKYQVSTYVLSLSWLLQKGSHILPIPGMDKREQVVTNKKAIDLIIEEEDLIKIDEFPDLYLPKHVDS